MSQRVSGAIRSEAESRDAGTRRRTLPTDDYSVRFYLQEIGVIPLLTKQEETTLSQAIEAGTHASHRLAAPLTTEERQIALEEVRQGECARRRMIESNLRLVVSIASRYSGRGLPLPDLIAEGNLGLMRAVEKFDHRKGYRFSTYATWWIRQGVARAIDMQARVVRLPGHVTEMMRRICKASDKLWSDLGRQPTVGEIALAARLSSQQVMDVTTAWQPHLSLERPYSDGNASVEAVFASVDACGQPRDHTFSKSLVQRVNVALFTLTETERQVLVLLYGLEGNQHLSHDDAGKELALTRSSVRQIEREALRRLRQQLDRQEGKPQYGQ